MVPRVLTTPLWVILSVGFYSPWVLLKELWLRVTLLVATGFLQSRDLDLVPYGSTTQPPGNQDGLREVAGGCNPASVSSLLHCQSVRPLKPHPSQGMAVTLTLEGGHSSLSCWL